MKRLKSWKVKSCSNNRRRANYTTTAKYFVTTVEAMPTEKYFDFLAVDEIQLCNDFERGHIFTDRLLNVEEN